MIPSMKLLVLGGTTWVGPTVAVTAVATVATVATGHDVTRLTRGGDVHRWCGTGTS